MPSDDQDKDPTATRAIVEPVTVAAAPTLGRTFRGETSPPITTLEAVVATQARGAVLARKDGAIGIHVYFVAKNFNNPIQQASMLAYTDVRTATPEDFDEIFGEHHEVPASKPVEEIKRP